MVSGGGLRAAPTPNKEMPSFYIENNTVKPGDNELRALHKWCEQLYRAGVSSPFPEGVRVLPSDNEERTIRKINLLLA